MSLESGPVSYEEVLGVRPNLSEADRNVLRMCWIDNHTSRPSGWFQLTIATPHSSIRFQAHGSWPVSHFHFCQNYRVRLALIFVFVMMFQTQPSSSDLFHQAHNFFLKLASRMQIPDPSGRFKKIGLRWLPYFRKHWINYFHSGKYYAGVHSCF